MLLAAVHRTVMVIACVAMGVHSLRDGGDMDLQQRPLQADVVGSSSQMSGSFSKVKRTRKFKALLVGFEYGGDSMLKGTCYDMQNMIRWAVQQGYAHVRYFTDLCKLTALRKSVASKAEVACNSKSCATKSGLRAAFKWLLKDSVPGDALLFHYSGHGASFTPTTLGYFSPSKGEKAKYLQSECDGNLEALVLPSKQKDFDMKSFKQTYYADNELFLDVAEKVPVGVHLFAIVDACHSGTVFDLPWNFMSQKYYFSCPSDRSKRVFDKGQFNWEWKNPASLNRAYPLTGGTVTLISGSQNSEYSMDGGMQQIKTKKGKTRNVGGLLTYRLILDHEDHDQPGLFRDPILDAALQKNWSYVETIEEVVKQVTGGKLNTLKLKGKGQVPNFGASHRLDMNRPFSLDGSAFSQPDPTSSEPSIEGLDCVDNTKWYNHFASLKAPGCE